MLDIKIAGGTLIDGTGKARFQGDLGIEGDRIVSIGDLSKEDAKTVIDATGKFVSPGFIDFHTHSDFTVIYDHRCPSHLRSGVTTQVISNCGIGAAPCRDERKDELLRYLGTRMVGNIPVQLEINWNSMDEYLKYVESKEPATNIVAYVAQGPIRIDEMGFSYEKPTPEQLANMKNEIVKAMEAGCVGMSSGLIYIPGAATEKEELAELCKAMKPYGGFYCTHMRNEGKTITEALDEAIYIAKEGGVPLHVSHLKQAIGKDVTTTVADAMAKIAKARNEGMDISFDAYPYNTGSTSLAAFLPPWCCEGGVDKQIERLKDPEMRKKMTYDMENGIPGWQNFYGIHGSFNTTIVSTVVTDKNKDLEGLLVPEAAKKRGKSPMDFVFDLLIEERCRVQVIIEGMNQSDIDLAISHPWGMVGSDSMDVATDGILSDGKPHPRFFGTFGRIFRRYVRGTGMLSFEEAVYKLTGLPAKRLSLTKRGLLKEGYYADVVVFDPDTIGDKADYVNSKQYTEGIDAVLVNGNIAFADGDQKDVFEGRVLRRRSDGGVR